jgi:hypothetical protein
MFFSSLATFATGLQTIFVMQQDSFRVTLFLTALVTALAGSHAVWAQDIAPVQQIDEKVETEDLPPEIPGLWVPADKGLRADLWEGIDFDEWQALLVKLPPDVSSPTLRTLLLGAVASKAELPAEEDDQTAHLRSNALLPATTTASWQEFVNTLPAPDRTSAVQDQALNFRFTEFGTQGCTETDLTNYPVWQLYCTIAAKKIPEAQLQADVLRDLPDAPEAVLNVADNIMAGEPVTTQPNPTVPVIRFIGLSPATTLNSATVLYRSLIAPRNSSRWKRMVMKV